MRNKPKYQSNKNKGNAKMQDNVEVGQVTDGLVETTVETPVVQTVEGTVIEGTVVETDVAPGVGTQLVSEDLSQESDLILPAEVAQDEVIAEPVFTPSFAVETPEVIEETTEETADRIIVQHLRDYSHRMGDTNGPSDAEIVTYQRKLHSLILSAITNADQVEAVADTAALIQFIAEDKNNAFVMRRVLRGVGRTDIFRTNQKSEEFRTLVSVFITLANPNLANDSFVDWVKLRDVLADLPRVDGVINVIKTAVGASNE